MAMSRNVETAMKNFIDRTERLLLNVLLKYCGALNFASDKILLYQNTSLPNRTNNKNEFGHYQSALHGPTHGLCIC